MPTVDGHDYEAEDTMLVSDPAQLRAFTETRWQVPARIGEPEQATLEADSPLLAQLLWNRGVRSATDAIISTASTG